MFAKNRESTVHVYSTCNKLISLLTVLHVPVNSLYFCLFFNFHIISQFKYLASDDVDNNYVDGSPCKIFTLSLMLFLNFYDINFTFLLLFKLRLGSSADTPEIGDLVLSRLCPTLSQVVGNGLKPFLNGFQMFGRVNVTVWKVAEISAEQGEFFQVEALTQGAPRLNFTV